jgi:hypothetical protein
MEKFQLSLFLKIVGIGSSSGLVHLEDKLYIISDNSTYLYEYHIDKQTLNKIALVENPQENIAKKEKPDFESIALKGNSLMLLGSGSKQTRNTLLKYNIASKKIKSIDFEKKFDAIKKQLNIDDDELNIEGLVFTEKTIYFFQRGNGPSGKNGIIYTDDESENPKYGFIPFDLPKLKHIPATFTDAILVDDSLYFLASAEDSNSTYLDGEVLGTIIGRIDIKTMQLMDTVTISTKNKFEGITLYKKSDSDIEFLLCEDNDTEELVAPIYLLNLKR